MRADVVTLATGSAFDKSPEPTRLEEMSDTQADKPAALVWFRRLCILCVLLGVAAATIGIVALLSGPSTEATMSANEFYTGAQTLTILGSILALGFGVAPFLPRNKTTWTVHLGLITMAMFFVIPMVIAVPLAFYWFGDDVERAYGVEEGGDR